MPDSVQGNMRTAPNNDVRRARYVNPECQWQGGSRVDCDERLDHVKVKRSTFTNYIGTVTVCMNHVAAYIRKADKDGVLA